MQGFAISKIIETIGKTIKLKLTLILGENEHQHNKTDRNLEQPDLLCFIKQGFRNPCNDFFSSSYPKFLLILFLRLNTQVCYYTLVAKDIKPY